MFAKSFTDDLKDLDPLFGPDAINYFSNDDKARVPLGLAVANLQAPIFNVRLQEMSSLFYCSVSLFKELKLDALKHGVNATGLSAFNAVERRIAKLSHDLSGIILPHDTYASHLNESGKKINPELEREKISLHLKFSLKSGQTLSLIII
ncbi:unnamed protein product [Lepeophtheirus salmonis]|uniref:(salmon louse) hypothetical protein n=1 Tax=Lepeophtheirus salmonis TaxID=72036 RepID=A0A7R8CZE7_LEPSM|nr:unnamed protein product [Lepeophtheirus salmonis]CAF2949881.1 unnamed protein product [Lepeophtheirus salmonis]